MKNLLKKLSINPNQSENSEGSNSSSRSNKFGAGVVQSNSQSKPFNAIAGWFNTMTNRKSPSPPSSSKLKRDEKMEEECSSSGGLDVVVAELESSNSKDPDIEEEYQIQLAMEMSAREDPEAVQIEAVKQISLGSCTEETTPAEVIAYRYWNYNALSYDDKILDGFYDLYGVVCESESSKIPSLLDLTAVQVSEGISWEAILVNRVSDANLVKLEQKALILAAKARSDSLHLGGGELVRQIAILVSDYMGGPVGEPANMLRAWKSLSYSLRSTLQSMVLPLGSLTIGLARHRALLFKVLADSVGIPCRLVKGRLYTGFDDVAMNTVKIDDGREFLVDLMADPGTLIPVDAALTHNIDYSDSVSSVSPLSRETGSNCGTGSSEGVSSFEEPSNTGADERGEEPHTSYQYSRNLNAIENSEVQGVASKPPAYSIFHARSPSWTEGVSSPAVRKMKVKDVSQYMIDAAKENPQLAQKLRDVLLESGVVAPRNLFSEIYSDHSDVPITVKPQVEGKKEGNKQPRESGKPRDLDSPHQLQFLPPLPPQGDPPRANKALALEPQPDMTGPSKFMKNVPVAAAAAAAAAVVASSMVAAVARSSQDPKFDLPVAAAATATAAAVVVTTAAVGKLDASPRSPGGDVAFFNQIGRLSSGDANDSSHEPQASNSAERTSDRSAGGDSASSARSDFDVADCEIAWEEITLGERIGLGSYGEVYRGDWHGTEVAVKKFLDQDLSGESLEEFRREIWLMKRLRHPNVVLFMGAVTRPPNLSIVTEFLHRGSLYRLIHRPNNQLDEKRRLRMALDTARGMNYLHNCSPVVVHRDLKTPNLLVDKNWVVKVCDFGLSRIKNHTFLSSRSAAGTAEWMAPEVLRNEPSDEKSDVYSFGVILWELCTLKQPWEGMNPMQVVGAVGFQNRRLDIPDHLDPVVADIIHRCWQTDPKLRPTFAEIMAALKPLQKPITASHVPRPSSSRSGNNV